VIPGTSEGRNELPPGEVIILYIVHLGKQWETKKRTCKSWCIFAQDSGLFLSLPRSLALQITMNMCLPDWFRRKEICSVRVNNMKTELLMQESDSGSE
jgi:hypothetical protein